MPEKITPLHCLKIEPYRSILIALSAFTEGLELKHLRFLLLEKPGFSEIIFKGYADTWVKKLQQAEFSFQGFITKSSMTVSQFSDCLIRMKQVRILDKIENRYRVHQDFYKQNYLVLQQIKNNIIEILNYYQPSQMKSYVHYITEGEPQNLHPRINHLGLVMGVPWKYIVDKDDVLKKINLLMDILDEVERKKLDGLKQEWIRRVDIFQDKSTTSEQLKKALTERPFNGAYYAIEFSLLSAIHRTSSYKKEINPQDWNLIQSIKNNGLVKLEYYKIHYMPMSKTPFFHNTEKEKKKEVKLYNKTVESFWSKSPKKERQAWIKEWSRLMFKKDYNFSYEDIKKFVDWGWEQATFIEETHPLSIAFVRYGEFRSIDGKPLRFPYQIPGILPQKVLEKLGGEEISSSYIDELIESSNIP
jgi:hypothetical protein